ncbi:MAG: 3-deoxy-D-manno-octulosonic acid transferase [Flavobacteriales bacterium]|nr:3-deoxy-D-manno-octulosonic acid transferase [Flavobacteriales bacterium]
MRLIYSLGVRLYGAVIRIISPFNSKAHKWVAGRRNWEKRYREILENCEGAVWMHCASLGEFEQGRPVLEAVKVQYPDRKIVLSFYSPSGYEIRKDWKGADAVIYLPLDTPSNARKLVSMMRPSLAIWVKYEFWYHHFQALRAERVPLILVSGIFRPSQVFFKPWGAWFRKQLKQMDVLFVQTDDSRELLKQHGIPSKVAGDTRFDRVITLAENAHSVSPVKEFVNGHPCLVMGSSWGPDEKLMASYLAKDPKLKVVVVPHEVDEGHIASIELLFEGKSIRYSQLTPASPECQVLIVDQIGLLGRIYKEADITYIGGGFGVGIHNTLEAAAYGVPIVFGPNHEKFNEAIGLIQANAAWIISDQTSFNDVINLLRTNDTIRVDAGRNAVVYVESHAGATIEIISYIQSIRRL